MYVKREADATVLDSGCRQLARAFLGSCSETWEGLPRGRRQQNQFMVLKATRAVLC